MFSKGKNSRGGAWRIQVPQPTCSWKSESENLTRRGGAKKCVNQWIEIHFVFVFVIVFVFASVFVIVFLLGRSCFLMTPITFARFRFGLEGFESITANMHNSINQSMPRAARA